MIRRLIILLLIVGLVIIVIAYKTYSKMYIDNCYLKCSDYHLFNEATHWNYNDFVIDNGDTIWVDEECYNDWCICIDECKAGLCCEFLK
jgi:hypothetical protein